MPVLRMDLGRTEFETKMLENFETLNWGELEN